MIYLIDDKINRQLDYGWNPEKFEFYSDSILSIHLYKDIDETTRNEMFSPGNIILFHESFFDNTLNAHNSHAIDIRNNLNEFSDVNKESRVVYFSGSKNSRRLDQNIAFISVSILYQNLETFIQKVKKGDNDLRYLLFGENYKIEEILLNKLELANKGIEESVANVNPKSKIFIAQTLQNEIETVFENADYNTFFLEEKYNLEITDEYLSDKIQEWFSEKEYDYIFIPLCFGPVLSDFNGLRFAFHLRCTNTPNQLKNIFLYSFVNYSYFLENKFFDILKTKKINLINYKKMAFQKAIEFNYEQLVLKDLSGEIRKIKLDPPKNYEDSHSIANEWAIYRWASAIQANDREIEEITSKVHNQLYFKFLSTICPTKDIPPITKSSLKLKYSGNPKILYIDDEADKGWYEIFCTILCDLNGLDFHYLDGELNSLTRAGIIKKSIETIKTKNIDVVLLDFRLHPDDFITTNIKEVSGLKLLKEIKALNPGIQVIIFSATNKIWNLQALQEAGADGFIVKESPENSVDNNFTNKAINSLITSLNMALKRGFLKEFFEMCEIIQNQLGSCLTEDDTAYDEFINDLRRHIVIIESAGKQINLKESTTLDIVFLNCYNFLEKFKYHYLNEVNYQFTLGIEDVDMNRYSNFKNNISDKGKFIRIDSRDNPSWFHCIAGLFIDYFSLATVNDKKIKDLNKIKDKRNSYIHGNKKDFDQNEISMILNLCVDISSKLKE